MCCSLRDSPHRPRSWAAATLPDAATSWPPLRPEKDRRRAGALARAKRRKWRHQQKSTRGPVGLARLDANASNPLGHASRPFELEGQCGEPRAFSRRRRPIPHKRHRHILRIARERVAPVAPKFVEMTSLERRFRSGFPSEPFLQTLGQPHPRSTDRCAMFVDGSGAGAARRGPNLDRTRPRLS